MNLFLISPLHFSSQLGTSIAAKEVSAKMGTERVELWMLGGDLTYSAGWLGAIPSQVRKDDHQ